MNKYIGRFTRQEKTQEIKLQKVSNKTDPLHSADSFYFAHILYSSGSVVQRSPRQANAVPREGPVQQRKAVSVPPHTARAQARDAVLLHRTLPRPRHLVRETAGLHQEVSCDCADLLI